MRKEKSRSPPKLSNGRLLLILACLPTTCKNTDSQGCVMFQIASIVAASKKALQLSEPIRFSPLEYENKIEFVFLPQKKFFRTEKYTASNVSLWFEQIKKNGIQDIKLLCPYSVKDRQFLGFSNTTESSILCFYKSGKVTYFTADWQFDSVQKKWNILYSEHEWTNPPSKKPYFENNINSFRDVLLSIKELAEKIECENFANIFTSAINLLDGCNEYPDEKFGLSLPPIPKQNLQMFEAASVSDVFGAMGSWNDSPAYMAHKKGLSEEYETLSSELLKNVKRSV